MSIRFSRLATAMLVVAVTLMTAGHSWATFWGLGPSKDEWGLKYDVQVKDTDRDTATVVFTLADEGRLKPFYKIELIAMSKEVDSQGGRSYDVKETLDFKTTQDGQRVAKVKIRKEFLDRAQIRILTERVDGQPQTAGLAYYMIPISKFMGKTPSAPPTIASPPASKITK